MPTGPRPLNRDERKVIGDALRRASADTRMVLETWKTGAVPIALGARVGFVEKQAETVAWLERLLGAQEQLARDVDDQRFELSLTLR